MRLVVSTPDCIAHRRAQKSFELGGLYFFNVKEQFLNTVLDSIESHAFVGTSNTTELAVHIWKGLVGKTKRKKGCVVTDLREFEGYGAVSIDRFLEMVIIVDDSYKKYPVVLKNLLIPGDVFDDVAKELEKSKILVGEMQMFDKQIHPSLNPLLDSWGVSHVKGNVYHIPTRSDIFSLNPMAECSIDNVDVEIVFPLSLMAYHSLYTADRFLPRLLSKVVVSGNVVRFPCHSIENYRSFIKFVDNFERQLETYQIIDTPYTTPFDILRVRTWLSVKMSIQSNVVGFWFDGRYKIFSWNNKIVEELGDIDEVESHMRERFTNWVLREGASGVDPVTLQSMDEMTCRELCTSVLVNYPNSQARVIYNRKSFIDVICKFGENIVSRTPFAHTDLEYLFQQSTFLLGFDCVLEGPLCVIPGTITRVRKVGHSDYYHKKNLVCRIFGDDVTDLQTVQKAWSKGFFMSHYQIYLQAIYSLKTTQGNVLYLGDSNKLNVLKASANSF